jgi:threonine dehydrogenase-like Zn-dependent dehydrogenase
VGEVVAVADDGSGLVTDLPIGTRVFALAPHAEYHVFEADALTILDPSIPAERAVLAANLETAITGVWDAENSLGDEVVVLGGGIVGLLTAWLARAAGSRVRLVEPSARRREAARLLGVDEVVSPDEDTALGSADVVIEATSDPKNLETAILHAGLEAKITVLSFYGQRVAAVPLGAEFHRRRQSIRASQVSRIPGSRSARWSKARRNGLVQTLLKQPVLDQLLEKPVPFERAVSVYAQLDRQGTDSLQILFRYDG